MMLIGGCRNAPVAASDAPASLKGDHTFHSLNLEAERTLARIRRYAVEASVPPDVRQRAEAVVARIDNGVHDPEPILVRATLFQGNLAVLTLDAFDEDEDILGIRIKEEHVGSDNQHEVLEEVYPVYIRFFSPGESLPPWIYIEIRDKDQRKDMQAWEDYLVDTVDWLIAKYIQKGERRKTGFMPTVWISAPASADTHVYAAVYDRRGNQSDYVQVENEEDVRE